MSLIFFNRGGILIDQVFFPVLVIKPAKCKDELIGESQPLPTLKLLQINKVFGKKSQYLQCLQGNSWRHGLDVRDKNINHILVLNQLLTILRILAG